MMKESSSQPPVGVVIVSAVIAVVLQLVLAPVITIFGVVPNFILVIVIITAMHNGPLRSTIMGFALGLIFDFCSLGPIGGMTLVLTILGYGVSSLNKGLLTGGTAVDIIIIFAAVFVGEFLTSVIYAIVGFNPDFLLSLVQRVLPAIVYDTLIGIIFMLIYNALFGGRSSRSSGGTGRSLNRKLSM